MLASSWSRIAPLIPLALLAALQCSNDSPPEAPAAQLGGAAGSLNGGAGQGNSLAGSAGALPAGNSGHPSAGEGLAGSGESGRAGSDQGGSGGTAQGGSGQGGLAQAGSGDAGQAGAALAGQAGEGGAAGQAGAGGASAGSAGTAGQQAAGEAGAGGAKDCPSGLPGPPLVRLASPDGVSYCIDRFEVSQQQYLAFLDAKKGDTSGQPEQCSWNKDFSPNLQEGSSTQCPAGAYDPWKKGALPMICADWCDARAYCAWAGKRLCGKIGGGSVAPESYADAGKSQWYNACSQGGKTIYPYGNVYQNGVCVDESKASDPAEAESKTGCHGQQAPFSEIEHLSGNVQEWEDSCQKSGPGGGLSCQIRGGTFDPTNAEKTTRCDDNRITGIAAQYITIGIRCCLDL